MPALGVQGASSSDELDALRVDPVPAALRRMDRVDLRGHECPNDLSLLRDRQPDLPVRCSAGVVEAIKACSAERQHDLVCRAGVDKLER